MYPEIINQVDDNGRALFYYDTLIFVNRISTGSVSAASSARSVAEGYLSGGGGSSFAGGDSMGGR